MPAIINSSSVHPPRILHLCEAVLPCRHVRRSAPIATSRWLACQRQQREVTCPHTCSLPAVTCCAPTEPLTQDEAATSSACPPPPPGRLPGGGGTAAAWWRADASWCTPLIRCNHTIGCAMRHLGWLCDDSWRLALGSCVDRWWRLREATGGGGCDSQGGRAPPASRRHADRQAERRGAHASVKRLSMLRRCRCSTTSRWPGPGLLPGREPGQAGPCGERWWQAHASACVVAIVA